MAFAQALVAEFNQEMQITRRLLERLPDGKFDWKPHAKSMSLGELASHIAEMANWGKVTVEQDELDLSPPGGEGYKPLVLKTRQALLDAFDAHVASTRAALGAMADASLPTPWSLLKGGTTLLTMPRGSVLRMFIFSHIVHHRGQLSVYLRLLDVPVPSMYGPSADEGGM